MIPRDVSIKYALLYSAARDADYDLTASLLRTNGTPKPLSNCLAFSVALGPR